MGVLQDLAESTLPHTLTILTTYQCTAACTQCCFESSPSVHGRLSRQEIFDSITEAKSSFPGLQLVVFSGGEAFLLKKDLFDAVALATSYGLKTRIVTNGSWGKTPQSAFRTADKLKQAGITEINISSGVDHQEWVPVQSVVNAAFALAKTEISTLITIEAENSQSSCAAVIAAHPMIREALTTEFLKIQSNSWMPFTEGTHERIHTNSRDLLEQGCSQVFETVVVTPHKNLSACCGLTLEHIPEMRLGNLAGESTMRDLYLSQDDDFLKYWIHVEGPYTIIERLFEDAHSTLLDGVVHICQACAVLHQSDEVKQALSQRFKQFVPEIMTRFALSAGTKQRELASLEIRETAAT